MRPGSSFRIAPNWLQIKKMTKTSQLSENSSIFFFDLTVFLSSSLVTSSNFMSISCLYRIDQKSGNCKYPSLGSIQYLESGQVRNAEFGPNVSNKMLLNAPKFQGYSF